jgi:protein-disulfide isomerase
MRRESKTLTMLLMAVLWATAASSQTTPGKPVATVDGTTVTQAELDAAIGNRLERLHAEEFRIRHAALNELVANILLQREAKARNISVKALLENEVEDQVPPPSDGAVEQAWSTAKGPIQQLPKEAAKAKLASMMRDVSVRQRREEYVASLSKRAQVTSLLEPPRLHVDDAAPYAEGDAKAPVTVVVFTDYQCPFCARAHTALRDAKLKYGRQNLRVAYRNLPLSGIHPNAERAAAAATCAGEQGSFWEMSERLFANQQALDADSLAAYATALKLDGTKFQQCLASPRVAAAIAADGKLADTYGVQGTPAIFINGRWVLETTLDGITRTIDEELGRTGARKPQPALAATAATSIH